MLYFIAKKYYVLFLFFAIELCSNFMKDLFKKNIYEANIESNHKHAFNDG